MHCLFYNALFEDPAFWGLLALVVVARAPARGGAGVIGGGPSARSCSRRTPTTASSAAAARWRGSSSQGADVRYVAFSIATRSLPEGFAPDTLAREVREATAELGIPAENLTVHDFDVRTFPDHRQEILELLIEIWNDWQPDCVFQPSLHDVHQDHQTIANEGLRAFKRTTILGYEIPWNNFDFSYQAYIALEQRARRAEGRRAREVRVAAAPPLRERGVRLERRAHARHQREPRVRRGVPGVPRRRLEHAADEALRPLLAALNADTWIEHRVEDVDDEVPDDDDQRDQDDDREHGRQDEEDPAASENVDGVGPSPSMLNADSM